MRQPNSRPREMGPRVSAVPVDVAFRDFTVEDRETALHLMRAYYSGDGHEFVHERAAGALDEIANGKALARLWLIQLDDSVVGYVCITLGFSLEVGGNDFFLDELFVVPEARGKGLGRAALDFIEAKSRELGARRICLEVERHNVAAREIYTARGYREHDRHLMSKWF